MLIWARIVFRIDTYYPDFDAFLGPDHGVLFTIPFTENKRRGLGLDHQLTIYYRDYDEISNKSVRHAVQACHGMTLPNNMVGDYVAMSGRPYAPPSEYRDMNLADFRHVLDYFSTNFDETIRETPSGGYVWAVQISCPLEQTLKSREALTSVAVDRDFPCTRDISKVSVALGVPVWVCKLERDNLEREMKLLDEPPENPWQNPYAEILVTDIDAESEDWGKARPTWCFDGSVVLWREYGIDLEVKLAQHMCDYCLEVLKPLLARSLAGEISRQHVLAEITFEKMMAWRPVESPREVMGPMPQRGFVDQIGSRRWQEAKQQCRVLRVTEEALSGLS